MFAGHLPNAFEVPGRQFLGELPGGLSATDLRDENAVSRNQDRPVFKVANAKSEAGLVGPYGDPAVQSQATVAGVQQRHDDAPSCGVTGRP